MPSHEYIIRGISIYRTNMNVNVLHAIILFGDNRDFLLNSIFLAETKFSRATLYVALIELQLLVL